MPVHSEHAEQYGENPPLINQSTETEDEFDEYDQDDEERDQ